MARMDIPDSIDMNYVNEAAGLAGNFNITESHLDGMKAIEFLNNKLLTVDAVLDDYDAGYIAWRKNKRLEEIAEIRRFHELRGPSGLILDDKTVLRLTVIVQDLMRHPEKSSVRWEVSRGTFVSFPRATILELADASVAKVQACFDKVYELTELVKGVTLTTDLETALQQLEAIDLTTGWPA